MSRNGACANPMPCSPLIETSSATDALEQHALGRVCARQLTASLEQGLTAMMFPVTCASPAWPKQGIRSLNSC